MKLFSPKYMKDLLRKFLDKHSVQNADPPVITTPINFNFQPDDCKEHHFGLSAKRWENLRGKSYWVTGAGTGYGRCISVALAAAGATVFLSGRRMGMLQETINKIESLNIDTSAIHPIPTDITNSDAVVKTALEISCIFGGLNGLVHCAGLPQPPAGNFPLADMTKEQWDAIIATNVTAPWSVTQTALPLMSTKGSIRVLFLSSNAGWHFTPGVGSYNISKAALNNLGASFAAECTENFPDCDTQINVLDPGEARTEMNQASTQSAYEVVPMTLILLSQPPSGPNGCFFNRYGEHLSFGTANPFSRPLA